MMHVAHPMQWYAFKWPKQNSMSKSRINILEYFVASFIPNNTILFYFQHSKSQKCTYMFFKPVFLSEN